MNLLNNKTMGLFNFWKKKNSPISEGKSVGVSNDTQESKNDLITIVWGTGMPIDVIFNFIEKDFEEIGYKDALVNSDIKYHYLPNLLLFGVIYNPWELTLK